MEEFRGLDLGGVEEDEVGFASERPLVTAEPIKEEGISEMKHLIPQIRAKDLAFPDNRHDVHPESGSKVHLAKGLPDE
jgi:hypothetical protein